MDLGKINVTPPAINPAEKVFEIKTYRNMVGMTVQSNININDPNDVINIGQTMAVTPDGQHHIPVEFEFPENFTITQCFENFKDLAKKQLEEQIAEMKAKASARENKIVGPSGVPVSKPITAPAGWGMVQ